MTAPDTVDPNVGHGLVVSTLSGQVLGSLLGGTGEGEGEGAGDGDGDPDGDGAGSGLFDEAVLPPHATDELTSHATKVGRTSERMFMNV